MTVLHHLVAHAGGFGWDEALFMAIPVVVLLFLGRQAKKKAEQAETTDTPSDEG